MPTLQLLQNNIKELENRAILPDTHIKIDEQEWASLQTTPSEHFNYFQYIHTTQNLCFINNGNQDINEQYTQLEKPQRMQFSYCIGFDDGHLIRKILQNLPTSSRILCVEPWPEIFFKVCETQDISDILSDSRFDLLLGMEQSESRVSLSIQYVSRFDSCIFHKKSKSFLHPKIQFLDYQKHLMSLMLESIKMKGNMKRTSDESVKLYLRNTPKGLRCGDINHLREKLSGKPYVAVGLGPSLAYQIQELKKIQDKVFIGVSDNALRELLDAGIDPDIVFQVEWRIESLGFYHNLKFRKPAVFCYMQGIHPKILEAWPYDFIAYPSPYIDVIFGGHTQGHQWPAFYGTTVGDFAIQVGLYAQASEIYLLGMDCSCPAGSYHHPNTSAMREQYGETSRFWSPEKWDWRHVFHDPQKVETISWSGEKVYSHASLKRSIEVISTLNQRKGKNQVLYTTSHMGAKLEIDVRSLLNLENYPKLNKNLQPSQDILDHQVVLDILKTKHQEFQRYFSNLKDLKSAAIDFISSQSKSEDHKLHMRNQYLKTLNAFQSDGALNWLERFVLLIDAGISIKTSKDKSRLLDEDEETILLKKAELFLDYIDGMFVYKDLLNDHLKNIRNEFSPHV